MNLYAESTLAVRNLMPDVQVLSFDDRIRGNVKSLDETRSLLEATLSSNLLVKSEIDVAFRCDKGIQQRYG